MSQSQRQNSQSDGQQPIQLAQGPDPEKLVDKLVEQTEKAEYRLRRGDRDELFEGLHDKSHSLTVISERELAQRYYDLAIERDLLAMQLPRPGSPWSGEMRSKLMGDDNDRLEAPDEIAMQRNYRIALDKSRQSRSGGMLLKRVTQVMQILEKRDEGAKGKTSWWRRLIPTPGGGRR